MTTREKPKRDPTSSLIEPSIKLGIDNVHKNSLAMSQVAINVGTCICVNLRLAIADELPNSVSRSRVVGDWVEAEEIDCNLKGRSLITPQFPGTALRIGWPPTLPDLVRSSSAEIQPHGSPDSH